MNIIVVVVCAKERICCALHAVISQSPLASLSHAPFSSILIAAAAAAANVRIECVINHRRLLSRDLERSIVGTAVLTGWVGGKRGIRRGLSTDNVNIPRAYTGCFPRGFSVNYIDPTAHCWIFLERSSFFLRIFPTDLFQTRCPEGPRVDRVRTFELGARRGGIPFVPHFAGLSRMSTKRPGVPTKE